MSFLFFFKKGMPNSSSTVIFSYRPIVPDHSDRYSIRAAVMLVMSASQESCGARAAKPGAFGTPIHEKYIHNEQLNAEHEVLRVVIPFENHHVVRMFMLPS